MCRWWTEVKVPLDCGTAARCTRYRTIADGRRKCIFGRQMVSRCLLYIQIYMSPFCLYISLRSLVPVSLLLSSPSVRLIHPFVIFFLSPCLCSSLPLSVPPSLSPFFRLSLPPSFPPSFPPSLPHFLPPSIPPSLPSSLPPSLPPSLTPSLASYLLPPPSFPASLHSVHSIHSISCSTYVRVIVYGDIFHTPFTLISSVYSIIYTIS